MILSLPAALLAVLFSAPAPQQTAESRTALVTVSDARNRSIVDLGPDDFVITERGQSREILDARPADYPIVVLVDAGAAARSGFPEIRRAVGRFLARLGQRAVELGTLGDPPATLATFDDERSVVMERLERMTAGEEGNTLALQAAAAAARRLRDAGSRFSAIVIVSASPVDASRGTPEDL